MSGGILCRRPSCLLRPSAATGRNSDHRISDAAKAITDMLPSTTSAMTASATTTTTTVGAAAVGGKEHARLCVPSALGEVAADGARRYTRPRRLSLMARRIWRRLSGVNLRPRPPQLL